MNGHLIRYMSSGGATTCRGHICDEWGSEFEVFPFDSEGELLIILGDKLANDRFKDQSSELHIFSNGLHISSDGENIDIYDDLVKKAQPYANELFEYLRNAEENKRLLRASREKEYLKNKEIAELKRLMEKYGK